MLMRFDPFRELDRVASSTLQAARTAVPMDAHRKGDQFFVEFDLPGIDASSIELTVERNVLTVRAQRRRTQAEGDEWLVRERTYGEFTRQLFLGETLDTDRLQATYDRGVLTLTIPVAETAKPRRVEVTEGASGPKSVEAGVSAA